MNMAARPGLLTPLADWAASDLAARPLIRNREALRQVVLDWLAALAAGWRLPEARLLARAARADGRSGQAFFLGALSHLAEVDDGHRRAMLHAGVVTLSPLWTVAAAGPVLTLGRFAAAISAGYEAAVRVGAALGKSHYRRYHATGTAGSFGAAAAAGVALGLRTQALTAAMAHAAAQANGPWQFLDDGADAAKATHAGYAARNGILGAALAEAGIAAPPRILEGRRGLAALWSDDFEPAPLTAPFTTETSAVLGRTVKTWPVCGQMHHVLDAVVRLRAEGLEAQDIAALRIESFAALIDVAGGSAPKTLAQARFSTPFCVAHLIVRGRLGFADLDTAEALADPAIRLLMDRIVVSEDPAMTALYPETRQCRLTVAGYAGKERVLETTGRRGDPEQPLTATQFDDRFRQLAGHMPQLWQSGVARIAAILTQGRVEDELPCALMQTMIDVPSA